SLTHWNTLADPRDVPLDAAVTLGLDGSRWRDGTGIVVTDILGKYQWKHALWTVDDDHPQIPVDEVDQAIHERMETRNVIRFYYDPAQGWADGPGQQWEGRYGKKVARFETGSRNVRKIADATGAYVS